MANASARRMGAASVATSVQAVPAGLARIDFAVAGMTCGGCAVGIRIALSRLDGVAKAEVSYQEQRAVVTFDPAKVSTDRLLESVRKFGYKGTLLEVKDRT